MDCRRFKELIDSDVPVRVKGRAIAEMVAHALTCKDCDAAINADAERYVQQRNARRQARREAHTSRGRK